MVDLIESEGAGLGRTGLGKMLAAQATHVLGNLSLVLLSVHPEDELGRAHYWSTSAQHPESLP